MFRGAINKMKKFASHVSNLLKNFYEKASILGWSYKKRVEELLERVEKELDNLKTLC